MSTYSPSPVCIKYNLSSSNCARAFLLLNTRLCLVLTIITIPVSSFPSLISRPNILIPYNKHRSHFPEYPPIYAPPHFDSLPPASSIVVSSFQLDLDERNEPRLGLTFGFSADAAPLLFTCNCCHYFSDHVPTVSAGALLRVKEDRDSSHG